VAKLGLHTFAAAPVWDVGVMRALLPKLGHHKVRALEIPLLRPEEIDIDATRAFFEETGLEPVCSLGLPAGLDVIADPQAGLDFLRPAFEVTRAVGAFALSGVTYGTIGRTTGAAPSDDELTGTCRFLEQAARLAATFQLRLGIEPCNRYETHLMNTGAQARQMCETVGADNLFIHLDTYHMNIEEASFADGFAACGHWLGYVHLSESNRGVPGRGTIAWDDVFRALAGTGFGGIVTLESMNHVDPDIASGLAIWRPVAEPADDVIDAGLPFLHEQSSAAGFRLD